MNKSTMPSNNATTYAAQVAELTWKVSRREPHASIVRTLVPILREIVAGGSGLIINWHPLGFLQFKINKDDHNNSTKLHIWDDELRSTQNPPWLIHKHFWDIDSHILAGAVQNSIYKMEVIRDDEIPKTPVRLYKVEIKGQMSTLTRTDEVLEIRHLRKDAYITGEKYKVLTHEYHMTTVAEGQFASTITVSNERKASAFVIGDVDGAAYYEYQRIICPPDTWTRIIHKLLKRLE